MNKAFDSVVNRARTELPKPKSHPALEDLATLALEKEPSEADPIVDHLAGCQDCADLVLAMRQEALQEPSSAPETADEEARKAWERFQGRLENPPEILGFAAHSDGGSLHGKPLWTRLWFAYAVAAVLLMGLLISNRPQPGIHTDVKMISLDPIENTSLTRSLPEPAPETEPGRLVLSLASLKPEYPQYRVTITNDASGRVVFEEGLKRTEGEAFMVFLDKGALQPGSYEIQTFGGRKGSWHPLDTYELVINDP